MRFKNELCKDILRFVKDNGKYGQFVKAFQLFTKQTQTLSNTTINEQTLLKRLNNIGYSPLELLNVMGIDKGDCYYSDYLMHHHKNNMDFNKKTFEEFLNNKNIKNEFFSNVDKDFIIEAVQRKGNIPIITDTMTQEEIIYNNIPPTGFIMHAFRWATSTRKPNGDKFWGQINNEWKKLYVNKIKEKYNV